MTDHMMRDKYIASFFAGFSAMSISYGTPPWTIGLGVMAATIYTLSFIGDAIASAKAA